MVPRKKLTLWQSLRGVFCNIRDVAAKYPKIAVLAGQFIVTGIVGSGAVVGYSKIDGPPKNDPSVIELLQDIKIAQKATDEKLAVVSDKVDNTDRGVRRMGKILSRYNGIKGVIRKVDEEEEIERSLSGPSVGRHSEHRYDVGAN